MCAVQNWTNPDDMLSTRPQQFPRILLQLPALQTVHALARWLGKLTQLDDPDHLLGSFQRFAQSGQAFRVLKCSFSLRPSSSNLERRKMIVESGAFLGYGGISENSCGRASRQGTPKWWLFGVRLLRARSLQSSPPPSMSQSESTTKAVNGLRTNWVLELRNLLTIDLDRRNSPPAERFL